jgi:opine dehydrogenase
MENNKPMFCVIGAGHGGQALAAHLSILGFDVSLYNRTYARIKQIKALGGINVEGEVKGFAKLSIVTDNIEEAIKGREIIMVVVPAYAHRSVAESMAQYLEDGQKIVLNPGRTGGALEVRTVLKEKNIKRDIIIAEAQTFIYASRSENPGQVRIFRIKNAIPVAALPAYKTVEVLNKLRTAFPQFIPGDNVLSTGLDNIGAIFHPALTILNAGRIEASKGNFQYYVEGITPSISLILEEMDRERVAVADALGIRSLTAREWLYIAYDAVGRTLYEAMQNNEGYKGIMAPPTLDTRYIEEDVPMSLVPIASMGDMFNVPTPTIKAIIHLACVMHSCDYWEKGRTVEKLGIADLSVKDIMKLVIEGE